MSRTQIPLKHHLSSGCCMWSGIEDRYASMTGQTLPDAFLFGLSSYGETVFLSRPGEMAPFLLSTADGRTRVTYDQIKEELGLSYRISEGGSAACAIAKTREEIDRGKPVLLGPLDMFHLPYLSMYHRFHIPIHYVTMVGYDDEKQSVLIYDCDRTDLIELPLSELERAWQIEPNEVGGPNGFIRFSLAENLPDQYSLAKICLRQKAERQLCPQPDFAGVNAYRKTAEEFPLLKSRYSQSEFQSILISMTEAFGMVPKIPNEILGVREPDIPFQGNYDRLGKLLICLGTDMTLPGWVQAGDLFSRCGRQIQEVTARITQYICRREDKLTEIPDLFLQIGENARLAYEKLAVQEEK